jgi:hypothetical protein
MKIEESLRGKKKVMEKHSKLRRPLEKKRVIENIEGYENHKRTQESSGPTHVAMEIVRELRMAKIH